MAIPSNDMPPLQNRRLLTPIAEKIVNVLFAVTLLLAAVAFWLLLVDDPSNLRWAWVAIAATGTLLGSGAVVLFGRAKPPSS